MTFQCEHKNVKMNEIFILAAKIMKKVVVVVALIWIC